MLVDGRHVRFIGINAMELGHDGCSGQLYAAAARDRVKQLTDAGDGKLRLSIVSEAYDEHCRTLAYLFATPRSWGWN